MEDVTEESQIIIENVRRCDRWNDGRLLDGNEDARTDIKIRRRQDVQTSKCLKIIMTASRLQIYASLQKMSSRNINFRNNDFLTELRARKSRLHLSLPCAVYKLTRDK